MKSFIILVIAFLLLMNLVSAQNIYTFAGTGNPGYTGDGGPALLADLEKPTGIVTDRKGTVYFCEWYYGLIRKVDKNGIITKVAGGGSSINDLADGIPATTALVRHPWGLTIDSIGNLYFAEAEFNQVRKIDTSGIITTIAGVAGATGGFYGDGGLATNARFNLPSDVAIDKYGNIYIADCNNNRIRKVNKLGIITTIAGISGSGFSGDGGPAVNAVLYYPLGVATDRNNNIYIGDAGHRIRKINASGIITTIVGTGVQGNSGDGGLAINATMGDTRGFEVDSLTNLFFADRYYAVIRRVDSNGIITKVAGDGVGGGYSGDGGPATLARFYSPIDVTLDHAGNFYISDNVRIRKICSSIALPIESSSDLICASESSTLNVTGANSYTWSTGSTNPTIVVTPTVNTTYTVSGSDLVGCSYNAVITQSVNACVGLREYDIDEIKIYPNPAANVLNIVYENNVFENSSIEIINYLGEVCLIKLFSNTIDVSKLPVAIYTLKFNVPGIQSYYSKFIKE